MAVLFLAGSLVQAADRLRVGVTGFPPGIVSDEDGHASGPAADMLLKILGEAGYQADIRVYPSVRVRAMVESGDLDMSIATKVWDKDGIAFYVKHPFGEQKIALYWRDVARDVHSLAELDGRTVIVPLGQFTPAAMLRNKAPLAHLRESRDFEGAVTMLQNGRADYLLDWKNPVESQLDRLGLSLRHLDLPPVQTYVVIGRQVRGAQTIIGRVDAVMARYNADKTLPLR